MEDPDARSSQRECPVDLGSKILDLLRKDARSTELLTETLSHKGERVDADAIRSCLTELASRGLVRAYSSGGVSPHAEANGNVEPVAKADRWEITEEGRAVAEPRSGVAQAPYDRAAGGEQGGRDAGFWVLVVIGAITAVCAAYTLLTATGVLGGG